jgi:hypothetical protein
MNCVMAKLVNKYLFMPLISCLMMMSAFVLAVIYFSVYKATIYSLKQRLKENNENYIEQQNILKSYNQFHPHHRHDRVKGINLYAQRVSNLN